MGTQNANREFPGEYRLDVEDFGPIANASVDLRPLTVFIGPSNTGKSYLAILLYALHQCFGTGASGSYGRRSAFRDPLLRSIIGQLRRNDDDVSQMLEGLRNWLLSHVDNRSQLQLSLGSDPDDFMTKDRNESASAFRYSFPIDLDLHIRSVLEKAKGLDRYSGREIERCFGIDGLLPLVRISESNSCSKVVLTIPRESVEGEVEYDLTIQDEGVAVDGKISGKTSLASEIEAVVEQSSRYLDSSQVRLFDEGEGFDYYESEDLRFLLSGIAGDVFKSLFGPMYRNAFYLPADRTGVMHSHRVVVSALVQSATTAGLRRSVDIPILSGVLADFLDRLIEMSDERIRAPSRSRGTRARLSGRLASQLEQEVLRGVVRVESAGGGYPSFDYLPNGWGEPLSLMRASSMVSELAPVVLYLRYLVRPGDVLIIEEPESHLHPAIQVEFTRQIAGLVRAGIRVIVTTHSEWLLQELANLVQLSQLPEAERKGIAGADVALESDQVGAWLFEPQASGEGSTVREIGLDESGLYPAGFDDVAAAMHNDWAEILSRREDRE